ncbi:unnamed protein product [Rotaria sp. Silwood2]|nr:unnamed protein product [Rotaria sp. Silwood2]
MSVDIVPIRDMPFAAVTVCNANPYRKGRMHVAVKTYADEMHINLNESTLEALAFPMLVNHDGLLITNTCMPNTTEEQCALTARQQIAINTSLMAIWCSRCAPQCKHAQFSIDVSALPAPTAYQKASLKNVLLENSLNLSLPDDFATNYDAYMDANYLRVTVTCASPYVTTYKQQAKLTFVDTFSAIGGQTGLWIGLSTLSLMEFCELIYRLIMKQITLWRYWRNTQTEVQIISSTTSTTKNLPNQSQ